MSDVRFLNYKSGQRFAVSMPAKNGVAQRSELYEALEPLYLDRSGESDADWLARCIAEGRVKRVDE